MVPESIRSKIQFHLLTDVQFAYFLFLHIPRTVQLVLYDETPLSG